VIGIEVRGLARMVGKLVGAASAATAAARRLAGLASVLARRKLVARMSARAPRDPFWGKGSPPGAFLGRRTGQTAARLSPGGLVVQLGNSFRSTVGSPDPHVKLHEEGGTIHGTSPRGFLRIPTAAAQSPSGAEQQRFAGRSLRAVAGLFAVRTRGGRLWIAERQGGPGSERITLLFLLKQTARMRPRGIFAAVRAEMERELLALGQVEATLLVAKANA
jgi:hypothetical protein